MDPFREEFELLQNLCAKKLGLQLSLGQGIEAKVLNGYPQDASGIWRLPDLAYGGEAWAAVRLRVPIQSATRSPASEPFHLLEASLVYEDLDGQSHRLKECSLSLPWLAPEAYQALASDPTVVERFGELHAADLQEKARHAARRGDWDRVDALLKEAKKNAAENPWLQGILESLQGYAAERETESLSKEAMYASQRIRSRLADGAQSVGDYDLAFESKKPTFLRRKNEQGKRF